MLEDIKNMPEECRELYLKFILLRKQTKNLKMNLGNIKNIKENIKD